MGADFIFNAVAIEEGKEQETKEKMLKEVEKYDIPELSNNTRVKIITSLKEERSNELEIFCFFWEEALNRDFDDNYFPIDESGKILTNKEVKESLKKVIEEFFDSLNCRDVSYIEHKGDKIYITGGMSWGDSPTDSCNVFLRFENIPERILTAGGIKWD